MIPFPIDPFFLFFFFFAKVAITFFLRAPFQQFAQTRYMQFILLKHLNSLPNNVPDPPMPALLMSTSIPPMLSSAH